MSNHARHLETENKELRNAGQRLAERMTVMASALQEVTHAHDLLAQLVMIILHRRKESIVLTKDELTEVDHTTHHIMMENKEGVLHVRLEQRVDEPEAPEVLVACDCGYDAQQKLKPHELKGHRVMSKHGPRCAFRRSLKNRPDSKLSRAPMRVCLLHRIYFEGKYCPTCLQEIADAALKGAGSTRDGENPLPIGEAGRGAEDGVTQPNSVPDVHPSSQVGGTGESQDHSDGTALPEDDPQHLLPRAGGEAGPDRQAPGPTLVRPTSRSEDDR